MCTSKIGIAFWNIIFYNHRQGNTRLWGYLRKCRFDQKITDSLSKPTNEKRKFPRWKMENHIYHIYSCKHVPIPNVFRTSLSVIQIFYLFLQQKKNLKSLTFMKEILVIFFCCKRGHLIAYALYDMWKEAWRESDPMYYTSRTMNRGQ